MSQYPLIQIQTLSFVKGRMMTNHIELARKDKFLSDHINRNESSTICTFLSFQPHWRHPLPLKGRSLLTPHLSSALLSLQLPRTYRGLTLLLRTSFLAALQRRRILLLIQQLFSNLVLPCWIVPLSCGLEWGLRPSLSDAPLVFPEDVLENKEDSSCWSEDEGHYLDCGFPFPASTKVCEIFWNTSLSLHLSQCRPAA